jgi:nitroreductase
LKKDLEDWVDKLLEAIEKRRARRALSDKEIPPETLQRIMTAATYAPSCVNNQPWRFLVAAGPEALAKVHTALTDGNYWAQKAPVVVVATTKAELDCQLSDGRDYAFYDCGLAAENLMLQAVEEGLYAHPMAGYDPLKIKSAFGIPDEYTVLNLIAIGYPGDIHHLNDKHKALETGERRRKPQEEVICYDQWCF